MDVELNAQIQESEEEWANLQKDRYMLEQREQGRREKDKKIISHYCADNVHADIVRTLDLLLKYPALPQHDQETVEQFREAYPKKLSVDLIQKFEDIKDMYSKYLESGGEGIR